MSLRIVPIYRDQANAFITAWHRHHQPPLRFVFAIGVADSDLLVGVATAGRPIARHLDDGLTVEVTRVATDGTRNACSMLYGACWRTARERGYARAITYTRDDETGASLRAAGWLLAARRQARAGWDMPGRRRRDEHYDPIGRHLWVVESGRRVELPTRVSIPPQGCEAAQLDLFATTGGAA